MADESRRITLNHVLSDPVRYSGTLPQTLVDTLLDHKSFWVPDSKGGEPNHR